ncbi:helix-turn-helix domain-containing protein [Metaclostridioides mangenotii]|uniref:helix-turn-helix domain-containing protein n=1 Tax=Metaclostridioides mangenotii TaxID=1540 RepID=UPI0004640E3B|nr:helix-turn-helix transcriptional regulator [Clostridioides mangenotii]
MAARKKDIPMFGINVKKRLIELRMTQRELAKDIGVSENYLTDILSGRRSGKKYRHLIYKKIGLEDPDLL